MATSGKQRTRKPIKVDELPAAAEGVTEGQAEAAKGGALAITYTIGPSSSPKAASQLLSSEKSVSG